jgi:CheY-like chemotaxis protein/two-component sensor histidine kinase
MLNASLLKLTHDSRHLHELLRRQEQAIDNATRLLHALLDISRLESGAIDPQLAPVRLASVFADLQQKFEATADAKGIGLEFADSDVVVSTDRTLFTQLLQNLVANALKYTSVGAVRVSLERDPESLILRIVDSGMGIPAEKLDRIFDEYYQVDPGGSPRSGVGLGLAIVREVSRLLRLEVAVASQVGTGTEVSVRVPRQQILATTRRVPTESAAQTDSARPRGRLILLEDNRAVRAAIELFLGLEGYTTRSAASAAEALRLFAEVTPGDVFIADYRLDGRNTGLDLLQRLRAAKGWDVPAILLSGDLESMLRAVKGSIAQCRFLGKPVDAKALLSAIDALVACAPPPLAAN